MSAAASTETTQRCGSIDRAGTARRLETLYSSVLGHNSKLIAWAVYRYLDDIKQRQYVDEEFDQTFKGTAADAKWARLFLARLQQRLDDEDSRWYLVAYHVRHESDDKIQITIDIEQRADTINAATNWIIGLVDASNAAETEICALQAAVAGNEMLLINLWRADSIAAERVAEEAEVRASGTTANA